MKPNPPKPSKPTPAPEPKKTPAAVPDSTPAKPRAENDRLTIPLDKDGRPDFASMRDKTRDRVRKIVSDPAVARELGIVSDAAPAVSTLPPFVTRAAIQALSQLDTIIVSRATGAPASVVLAIAPYTEKEADAIAPALESVLNKYGGSILNKWGDEVALLTLLGAITMQKIEAVRAAMAANPRPPAPVIVHPSSVPAAPSAPSDEPPAAPVLDPEAFQ